MKRRILIFPAVVLLLLLGAYFLRGPKVGPKVSPGGLVVEASAEDILGYIRSLNSPLVLVNFWASWCEPCKAEFPNILKLRDEMAAQGLRVVFVSIDEPRDLAAAEEFLRIQHVKFQTYYKGSQGVAFITELYPKWEGAVPTTVLLGPKMEIVDAWEGDATLAEFEKRIKKHLRGT